MSEFWEDPEISFQVEELESTFLYGCQQESQFQYTDVSWLTMESHHDKHTVSWKDDKLKMHLILHYRVSDIYPHVAH